jgi:hypothetical protein
MRSTGTMAALLLTSTIIANAEESKAPPNLTGKYRCEPQPRECVLGKTFTVTLSGKRLEMENEKGEKSFAQFTSDTGLAMGSPWNTLGVVYGNSIQWSNGTRWVRGD